MADYVNPDQTFPKGATLFAVLHYVYTAYLSEYLGQILYIVMKRYLDKKFFGRLRQLCRFENFQRQEWEPQLSTIFLH